MGWTHYGAGPDVGVWIYDERYRDGDDQRPADEIVAEVSQAIDKAVHEVVAKYDRPDAGVMVTQA